MRLFSFIPSPYRWAKACLQVTGLVLTAVILALSINVAAAAWTPPTQNPPNGNTSLPWTRNASGYVELTTSSDKVGIGYSNPSWTLQTNGTGYFNGTLRFNGHLYADGNVVIDNGGGWHRSYGATGWYNGTYGGGWYMTDTVWLRSYNNKGVFTSNVMRADSGFDVGGDTIADGRYFYGNYSGTTGRFGQLNTNGFGIDALNDGGWDFLVYEGLSYMPHLRLGYGGAAELSTYDTNENLTIDPNGTGDVIINADLTVNGTISGSISIDQLAQKTPNYSWNAATAPRSFPAAISTSFVRSTEGWPSYGTVVHMDAYPSNDGAAAQLYIPYSSSYGGSSMRYRLGQYNNAGWTGWKTIVDTDGATFSGTIAAPTFYDSNNTAYYTDPAGTSQMNSVTTNGTLYARGSITNDTGEVLIDDGLSVTGEVLIDDGLSVHYDTGYVEIDTVINELANGYVRGSVLSSRDGDLAWNAASDVWTLGTGSSNDFAGMLHTYNGELGFVSGAAGSFTSLSNAAFRDQFQHLTIANNGNISMPNGNLTVNGDVCSNNGAYCLNSIATAGASSLQAVTDVGNTTTNSIRADGGYYINSDVRLFRDAANRLATDDYFYVRSSSPATYLYSDNTYLGASSGDVTQLRGNLFTGNNFRLEGNGGLYLGANASSGIWELYVNGQSYTSDYIRADGGIAINTSSDPGTGNLLVQGYIADPDTGYVTINDGLYVSNGTFYAQGAARFRNEISNDSSTNGGDVYVNDNLTVNGNVDVNGYLQTSGADMAERFSTREELPAGTVVSMGPDGYRSVETSQVPNDTLVMGVVSADAGLVMGESNGPHTAVVAMIGVVPVQVTAENGPIERGDLLTSSSVAGHAMKAVDPQMGTVIGKALEAFDGSASETGTIQVYINLQ